MCFHLTTNIFSHIFQVCIASAPGITRCPYRCYYAVVYVYFGVETVRYLNGQRRRTPHPRGEVTILHELSPFFFLVFLW